MPGAGQAPYRAPNIWFSKRARPCTASTPLLRGHRLERDAREARRECLASSGWWTRSCADFPAQRFIDERQMRRESVVYGVPSPMARPALIGFAKDSLDVFGLRNARAGRQFDVRAAEEHVELRAGVARRHFD